MRREESHRSEADGARSIVEEFGGVEPRRSSLPYLATRRGSGDRGLSPPADRFVVGRKGPGGSPKTDQIGGTDHPHPPTRGAAAVFLFRFTYERGNPSSTPTAT
jgi:hypothetical protein